MVTSRVRAHPTLCIDFPASSSVAANPISELQCLHLVATAKTSSPQWGQFLTLRLATGDGVSRGGEERFLMTIFFLGR